MTTTSMQMMLKLLVTSWDFLPKVRANMLVPSILVLAIGYSISSGAQYYRNSHYTVASGPVHIGNLQCTGSESSLLNCLHTKMQSCGYSHDSGVKCAGIR